MAAPSQNTEAVGDLVTASLWNDDVRDAVNWIIGNAAGRRPSLRAHMAAAQSIPNSTTTTVKFDTNDEDTDSAYSTTTGVFTCVTAGLYLFVVHMAFAANATGTRTHSLLSTGAPTQAVPAIVSAAVDGTGHGNAVLLTRLTVGQTVQFQVAQTSGGALNTATGATIAFSGDMLSL